MGQVFRASVVLGHAFRGTCSSSLFFAERGGKGGGVLRADSRAAHGSGDASPTHHCNTTRRSRAPPGAGLHASPVPSPGCLAAGVPVQANNGFEQKKPARQMKQPRPEVDEFSATFRETWKDVGEPFVLQRRQGVAQGAIWGVRENASLDLRTREDRWFGSTRAFFPTDLGQSR